MARKTGALLANILHAIKLFPPNYVRSILGTRDSWKRANNPDTELQLTEWRHFPGNLRTAQSILLPSGAGRPGWLPQHADEVGLFRDSSTALYPPQSGAAGRYPRESWLFLNGMCADQKIADLNAACLYRMFGRPLTMLHNQTHGFVLDLAECAVGKGWLAATEAVRSLFPAFYSELKRPDIDRVVLIAHSQGTILAAIFLDLLGELLGQPPSNDSLELQHAERLLARDRETLHKHDARVLLPAAGPAGASLLRLAELSNSVEEQLSSTVMHWLDWSGDAALGLPPLTEQELAKLEIYNFATCASHMPYLVKGANPLPYIEHFGNHKDLVARLGMFAPSRGIGSTHLDGHRFVRDEGWGHLLNAHYLFPLEQAWLDSNHSGFTADADPVLESRLKSYYQQPASPAVPAA